MNHEIDLEKYQLRSDLAIDLIDSSNNLYGLKQNTENKNEVLITNVVLEKENCLNKKPGNYITLEFDDITDTDNFNKVSEVLIEQLKKILDKMNIKKENSCLIVGLGNDKSTPDALGPQVIDKLIITNHIYELGQLDNNYRRVSAIKPGVTAQTGIETTDIIKSVVKEIKPDFLIVIDALASQSIDRVNKTIQMTDTGIHPGSGIGNSRKEVSFETIGIPVLAIGVPTVVDATVIVSDTINYMYKHYAFIKEYSKKPQSKLSLSSGNYISKNININNKDKEELLGLIGKLNSDEIKQLINEVLTPIGYNLMVTPKEVDFIILKLSELISLDLNKSIHNIG